MNKYFQLFKNRFQISLLYRFDILGALLIELLAAAGFLVLWVGIYKSENNVNNMTLDEAVVNYLFVPLVSAITNISLCVTLGQHIKDGFFSNQLIKPFMIWTAYVLEELGKKLLGMLIVFLFYVTIFVLLIISDISVDVSIQGILIGLFFAFMALVMHLAMDFMIAYLAFWIDEVWAFKHVKRFTLWVLGGVGFPLNILSGTFLAIVTILPFRFLYYVPLSYALGFSNMNDILPDLLILLFWIACFILGAYYMWRCGISKFGAYGG